MPRTKNTIKAEDKKQVLSPFDIINKMFTNHEAFMKFSDLDLSRNYFIINERMSIQYPMQAQVFNHYKINPAQVIRCWETFIRIQGYNRVPGFIYAKGKKKSAEENYKNFKKIPDKTLSSYAAKRNFSVKDVKFALEIYPEQVHKDIEKYEKELKYIEDLKKFKLTKEKDTDSNENNNEIESESNISFDPNGSMF